MSDMSDRLYHYRLACGGAICGWFQDGTEMEVAGVILSARAAAMTCCTA